MKHPETYTNAVAELNHACDFIKSGVVPESSAYSAGNSLADYISGER